MLVNTRILSAWQNWLVIPAMIAFWIVIGVELSQLVGAPPIHKGNT